MTLFQTGHRTEYLTTIADIRSLIFVYRGGLLLVGYEVCLFRMSDFSEVELATSSQAEYLPSELIMLLLVTFLLFVDFLDECSVVLLE